MFLKSLAEYWILTSQYFRVLRACWTTRHQFRFGIYSGRFDVRNSLNPLELCLQN